MPKPKWMFETIGGSSKTKSSDMERSSELSGIDKIDQMDKHEREHSNQIKDLWGLLYAAFMNKKVVRALTALSIAVFLVLLGLVGYQAFAKESRSRPLYRNPIPEDLETEDKAKGDARSASVPSLTTRRPPVLSADARYSLSSAGRRIFYLIKLSDKLSRSYGY